MQICVIPLCADKEIKRRTPPNNKQIQDHIQKTKGGEETKIARDIKHYPKVFYDYIKRFIQVKSNVGPLKKEKHYYSGPKVMSEILSAQYESAFSNILENYNHDHIREASCSPLIYVTFTVEDILNVIKDIQENTAPGPDGITVFLFKSYAEELASPLYYIWRVAVDTGRMPEGISVGIITPTFKEGNLSAPKDYRPVSLTNHTTKTFE